jgi:hypothetical protein
MSTHLQLQFIQYGFPLTHMTNPDSPFQMYTLKPPFQSNTHSYGKGLIQIMDQGHDGIFGRFKPAEMDGELWETIRTCWAMKTSCRLSMVEVEARLGNIRKAN